jgi:hypothetical protein
MQRRPYEQEELYTSVYEGTSFVANKWINWEEINHSKKLKDVEKYLRIGLHTLMSKR